MGESIVIQGAPKSPRYENGIWYWFANNTFIINWKLNLKRNGEPFTADAEDIVTFKFYNEDRRNIYTASFENISNNVCPLVFSEEVSKKFTAGNYTFCIEYNDVKVGDKTVNNITTIGADYKIVVEECH